MGRNSFQNNSGPAVTASQSWSPYSLSPLCFLCKISPRGAGAFPGSVSPRVPCSTLPPAAHSSCSSSLQTCFGQKQPLLCTVPWCRLGGSTHGRAFSSVLLTRCCVPLDFHFPAPLRVWQEVCLQKRSSEHPQSLHFTFPATKPSGRGRSLLSDDQICFPQKQKTHPSFSGRLCSAGA